MPPVPLFFIIAADGLRRRAVLRFFAGFLFAVFLFTVFLLFVVVLLFALVLRFFVARFLAFFAIRSPKSVFRPSI